MALTHISNFYKDAPERRIALCVFNRATYSRCKMLITELERYENVKLTLVLSAALLWDEFGKAATYIKRNHPHARIHEIPLDKPEGGHVGMARQCGVLTDRVSEFLSRESFHAVVLVADRHETLAGATAASYLNIPIIHIQGGEITGCIDDKVRNAVTKLSDYHFVSTALAKEYLIQMGEERERVFNTGCPSIDLIRFNRIKRVESKEKYILSIFHPETENIDKAYEQTRIVMESVLEYCAEFQHRCYWFYPNPDPGREEIIRYLDTALKENSVYLIKAINKEPEKFLDQLSGARVIIGNSSCGIRESSYLGVPSINVGDRQKIRERSFNVLDVGYEKDEIIKSLKSQHGVRRYIKSQLFGDGRSSYEMAKYIQAIDFSLKGPVTYPYWPKFREAHFGEERIYGHGKRPPARKAVRTSAKRGAVQGESGTVRTGVSEAS